MPLPAEPGRKVETMSRKFRVQASGGVDFGVFEVGEGEGPLCALNALARDAGYKDHEHACASVGEEPSDWTNDRYEFLAGSVSLLVTLVS